MRNINIQKRRLFVNRDSYLISKSTMKHLSNAINIDNIHVMLVGEYDKYRYTLQCNLYFRNPSNLKMFNIMVTTETSPTKKSDMLSTTNSKVFVFLFSEYILHITILLAEIIIRKIRPKALAIVILSHVVEFVRSKYSQPLIVIFKI